MQKQPDQKVSSLCLWQESKVPSVNLSEKVSEIRLCKISQQSFITHFLLLLLSEMPYMRISSVDRSRLVRCFQQGRDWRLLAVELDIKRTTANDIIRRYVDEGRIDLNARGGVVRLKFIEEMLEALTRYVEEKPTVTLKEMQQKLMADFPAAPVVTTQAISRRLDGTLCITLKDVRRVHGDWNSDVTKEAGFLHMTWMLETGLLVRNLIYVDECGCNLWTARTKGWADFGNRAVMIANSQRGQNLTVALAVSPQLGLVHHRIFVGGFTAERFREFMIEVGTLVDDEFTVLADNARAHGVVNFGRPDQRLQFLPPYSPFLNATEMAISCMKAALKRRMTDPEVVFEVQDRQAAVAAGETLQNRRLRILSREVEAAMVAITEEKCRQWHEFTLRYGPRCLAHGDILD